MPSRTLLRSLGFVAALTSLAPFGLQADDTSLAVNHVAATERLHTAGQPSAEALATLDDRGFDLVVNLAPPTSRDAVANEGKLVAEHGAAYVNIPVDWQKPTLADFELFSAVLGAAEDRKVLVHCQMNMRASVFTFLYRVVHEHVAPEEAFAAVQKVWVPRDQWATFTKTVLEKNNIDFELPAAN